MILRCFGILKIHHTSYVIESGDFTIFHANLVPLVMSDFDFILGIHFLIEHQAIIDCHYKKMTVHSFIGNTWAISRNS